MYVWHLTSDPLSPTDTALQSARAIHSYAGCKISENTKLLLVRYEFFLWQREELFATICC